MSSSSEDWLARFHAGDRRVLEECYREHFSTVEAAVGHRVTGADRENVVHDVFFTLLSSPEARRSFHGGSLVAWLSTVAHNRAIDYLRSRRPSVDPRQAQAVPSRDPDPAEQAEARLTIERFRRDQLPEKWVAVFEARFIQQLSQREAAARLGCSRTTLAYQELRIRALLRRYLLRGERDR